MATGRVPTTANSPLTAKGDLFTYSTAPARLAVGNNGEQIVADSSTSTGLRYQGNYAAGKNEIINGAFDIWQRGTSISISNNVYTFGPDRYQAYVSFSAGTSSWSQQTFTPGTAPVAGYEGQYFARLTCGSTSTYTEFGEKIEDVRTLAGQTATFSFWAKASASIAFTPYIFQIYGSGGSTQTAVNGSAVTLTTSWTRYTVTLAVPSIAGKTIGTGSNIFAALLYSSGTLNSATVDIWGWQLEAGSVATAFQTATGTLQGELAACQRYYWRNTGAIYMRAGIGIGATSASAQIVVQNPVPMRVAPTAFDYSTLGIYDQVTLITATNATIDTAGIVTNNLNISVASGVTQYRPYVLYLGSASGYLGFSAEL